MLCRPGVRLSSWAAGLLVQVGVNYDPMIAKVVCSGPDRASALASLHGALQQLQVSGLPTNAEFLKRITQNREFQRGAVDTSFIAEHEHELLSAEPVCDRVLALAALVFQHAATRQVQHAALGMPPGSWSLPTAFRCTHVWWPLQWGGACRKPRFACNWGLPTVFSVSQDQPLLHSLRGLHAPAQRLQGGLVRQQQGSHSQPVRASHGAPVVLCSMRSH